MCPSGTGAGELKIIMHQSMLSPWIGGPGIRRRICHFTWPIAMQNYWNKRKFLHKKRVQSPQDCLEHQHGPCFIILEHQYGRCFIVFGHQHGRHDIMRKCFIPRRNTLMSNTPSLGLIFFLIMKDDLRCTFPYHCLDINKVYHSRQIFFLFIGREPTT